MSATQEGIVQKEINIQIKKIKASLKELEECIEANMFNEKGLAIITKNLEEISAQVSDISWLTILKP